MILQEGQVLNTLFYRRLIRENQNILIATCGKTGSGKSYADLRICELWYAKKFKRSFPIENVCFTIEQLLDRLVNGNLQRGEILILEEGGVNVGSLDFQNKISKTFNYVLQSFRSMNIGLIINLPVFSMLNKQTRMLMHLLLQTMKIDKTTNKVEIKPLQLQWNQQTGKLYNHKPRILIDGCLEAVDFISYSMPSEELRSKYEERKKQFVGDLANNVLMEIKKDNEKKIPKEVKKEVIKARPRVHQRPLTELQAKILEYWKKGITNQTKIAKEINEERTYVCRNFKQMANKGYFMQDYISVYTGKPQSTQQANEAI